MKKTILLSVFTAAAVMISGCGKKESESKNKDSRNNSSETEESGNLMFDSGLAMFYDTETELLGYIGKDGEWAIEPQFENAHMFSSGCAVVWETEENDSKISFIDKTGKKTTSDKYEISGDFISGFAIAIDTETSKVGFINTKGEWAIEPKFDGGKAFASGAAAVCEGELYGFIDTEGSWIAEPQFSQVFDFSDGLALVIDENNNEYYINIKGEKVLDAKAGAESFHDGRAVVMDIDENENDVFGIIDKSGDWIVEPKNWVPSVYSDGLCKTMEDGKYGYIDVNGDWAIEPKYENADNFSGGLAAVYDGETGLYGFIGKDGKWAIKPQYSYFMPFTDDGYAYASTDGKELHIIDKKGNIIK